MAEVGGGGAVQVEGGVKGGCRKNGVCMCGVCVVCGVVCGVCVVCVVCVCGVCVCGVCVVCVCVVCVWCACAVEREGKEGMQETIGKMSTKEKAHA